MTRNFSFGWYIICSPCGYILYDAPLLRSEGEARVAEIWEEAYVGVDPMSRPNYIFTDISCKVQRYIENNNELKQNWSNTKFVLDRYHPGWWVVA